VRVKVSAEVPWERQKARKLERFLGHLMRKMRLGGGLELSVLLVEEERIRELNRVYMWRDEETDVLAFPQLVEDELAEAGRIKTRYPEPLGDIVICLPIAKKQAEESGITEKEEIDLLAVHGLLHLIGFDDETDDEADRMREVETGLLGRSIYAETERE
jgi:probable rRNA maturation factor